MLGRNAILHVAKPFSFTSEGLSMVFPKKGDYNIPHAWIGPLKAAGLVPGKATVKETVQLTNPADAAKLDTLLKPGPEAPAPVEESAKEDGEAPADEKPKKGKKTKTPDAAERAGIITK